LAAEHFDRLDLFHGEASTTLGRVYARLPASPETAGCTLAGRVVGPICRWANTLPATSPLVARPQVDNRQTEPLLAEAVVPDPCFWSDELPMRYTVELKLQRNKETIATTERTIAFRGVGRRGRSLFQQGRRWVPRGMNSMSVLETERADLAAWRLAPAVLVTADPTDSLCSEADELGLWIIADLSPCRAPIELELARFSQHAAVFLAILPPDTQATRTLRIAASNLLLAVQVTSGNTAQADSLADCLALDATNHETFARTAQTTTLPIIAGRPLKQPTSLAAARQAVDHLQRDLAPIGDFAGYLV
jgi:hypothetical protein